jgi:hypothetical protein
MGTREILAYHLVTEKRSQDGWFVWIFTVVDERAVMYERATTPDNLIPIMSRKNSHFTPISPRKSRRFASHAEKESARNPKSKRCTG